MRERTRWLLDRVPDEFLRRRVHDFYSPIGWHFGHVGRTEEYWVVGEALKRPLLDDELSFLFADLVENPKDNRVNIPDRAGIIEYLERTRRRVLDALDECELECEDPYLADGYAWEFAIQHECQHQETIAEMLQLIHKQLPSAVIEAVPWQTDLRSEMVDIPGGTFCMGTDDRHVYDNEKEPHEVSVASFRIGRTPVTAFEWTQFMDDGGYRRPELWSEAGWAWRDAEQAEAPEYWVRQGDAWAYIGPFGARSIHPDEPASSLSWFEAEAYARWAGKRLPTEEEWEYVASHGQIDPAEACHGLASWGPTPVGRRRPNPLGLHDLSGNVWEWTSTPFLTYPGFAAFPYDGYSKDHMKGAHRVCRGGSWATAAPILRRTFRNWYVPTYRQGFLGVRLAE
ncbi:SUMF1/EgtB/PvdO family nonheme iron enzyme [Fimbriimonas ginsengisoli]|uniref:SUMF1/EgtB/PvdO family nonheme iron enzyme n=1 Tax=Fimbriimonas ginsengisoli TaxID=1005039 RepID=UPI00223528A1|nr:SUMF1/EgtB/PvdO family nonheme iron enzyme [Fimbriimonas ginsengisoli]